MPGTVFAGSSVNTKSLPPGPHASNIACDNWPNDLRRLQIGNAGDDLTDDLLRRVGEPDAGDDLARLRFADIDRELEQFVALRHALGGENFRRAQIDGVELIVGDFGFAGAAVGALAAVFVVGADRVLR